jgi:hypothetical protein
MSDNFTSVSVEATGGGLLVRWSNSPVGPAQGSYSIQPSIAARPSPAALLAALPALIAVSRRGGRVLLRPMLLAERGMTAAESTAFRATLAKLGALLERTIATIYGDDVSIHFELEAVAVAVVQPDATAKPRDARQGLLFGGGVESLLTLAQLLARGPVSLIGLSGPGWPGSDSLVDKKKLEFDDQLAHTLGLPKLLVETSAYAAMVEFQAEWAAGLQGPLFFANAIAFAPLVVGLSAPWLGTGALSSLHLGSENDHAGYHTVYCLSPEFLFGLSEALSSTATFTPELLKLSKAQIVQELWARAPELGRQQYSCFSGRGARWCCQCEKCFRSYALLIATGVDPAEVELDATRLLRNLPRYVRRLANLMAFSSYHSHVYREVRQRAIARRAGGLAALLTALASLALGLRARAYARKHRGRFASRGAPQRP